MTRTTTGETPAAPAAGRTHPLDSCCIVDVRTPGEFRDAHIEGAINVPLPDVGDFAASLQDVADGREIVVVCRTGKRAERACGELEASGIASRVLRGGLAQWEAEGYPVTRGEGGMSIERQTRIVAGSLVVLGVVLGFLVHPAFSILSALVGAGLAYAGLSDSCAMGMLLARMPWNRASAPIEAR